MRCVRFRKMLFAATVFATAGCGADRAISPPPDTLESRIQALGFSVSGMQDYGTYIVVEGDIRLEKAILMKGLPGSTDNAPSPGLQVPLSADYQYHTTTTVSSAYVAAIRVNLTGINSASNWASAARTAMAAYNASGSNVYMYEANPGDITFSSVGSAGYYAIASFPYQGSPPGKPGPTITVNRSMDSLALSKKQWVLAHEFGHTLALRHDNAPVVEPDDGGIGTHFVSGTVEQDLNSVMQKYYSQQTWTGFSQYDVIALRVLYPRPPSVSISGPQYVTRYQSAQYFANVTYGTAPYTYQWRSRQCTDGGGYNCGAWSNWYSTGSQNFTYASINSCGLNRNELQALVTDAQSLTGTGWLPIWITNPC